MAKKKQPETASIMRLSELFGVTDRWLRKLENQGYIVKLSYGVYDLVASIQGYIKWQVESELKNAPPAAGTSKDLFEAERARKLKLENDQKEALLIETPDVIAAIDHILGEIRTALSGIPARFTTDLAERRRLENEIDNVLEQLADRYEQASAALVAGRDPSEAYQTHDA